MGEPDYTLAIIFVAFLIAAFLAWFFVYKYRQEERRLLIEKDIDISQLPDRKSFSFNFPWLKIGCLITCISIGLIIGLIFLNYGYGDASPIVGMAFFGGVGMIIAHYIGKSDEKRDK